MEFIILNIYFNIYSCMFCYLVLFVIMFFFVFWLCIGSFIKKVDVCFCLFQDFLIIVEKVDIFQSQKVDVREEKVQWFVWSIVNIYIELFKFLYFCLVLVINKFLGNFVVICSEIYD